MCFIASRIETKESTDFLKRRKRKALSKTRKEAAGKLLSSTEHRKKYKKDHSKAEYKDGIDG